MSMKSVSQQTYETFTPEQKEVYKNDTTLFQVKANNKQISKWGKKHDSSTGKQN